MSLRTAKEVAEEMVDPAEWDDEFKIYRTRLWVGDDFVPLEQQDIAAAGNIIVDDARRLIAELIERSREEGRREILDELRERFESAEHPDDLIEWIGIKVRTR